MDRAIVFPVLEDNLTSQLGRDIFQIIFSFIPPPERKLYVFTCSSWYFTIKGMEREDDEESIGETAAFYGYLGYLKYLDSNGYKLDGRACARAAEGGKAESLKYLMDRAVDWRLKDSHIWFKAAKGGSLECFKLLHQQGCIAWNNSTSEIVAGYGNIVCLDWLIDNLCPIGASAEQAAMNGKIEVLKYLQKRDISLDKTDKILCALAALGGHLECMQYLRDSGFAWDSTTTLFAAEKGYLDCLKYARTNGCEWNSQACELAAHNGQLECLKYCHENGCEFGESSAHAAMDGTIECLKYIHENGGDWAEDTCAWAASRGLEFLKYAHENGCPWDEQTCSQAAEAGEIECLRYAHENGCPCDDAALKSAQSNGHKECEAYIRSWQ